MHIEESSTEQIEDATWRAMHRVALDLQSEELPGDPPTPFEEYLHDERTEPSYRKTTWWLAWDGDDLVGFAHYRRRLRPENRHIAPVWVAVPRSHRRSRIGSVLMLEAAKAVLSDGRSIVECYTFREGPGSAFMRSLGAEHKLTEAQNRLVLDQLDRRLIEQWVERAHDRASDYELLLREGGVPDGERERAATLAAVMNDAPRSDTREDDVWTPEMLGEMDELARRDGWTPLAMYAVHRPSGEWIGYTKVWPSPYRNEFVYQDDTGVLPQHRNNGLGRWLKAAMLLKILEELPNAKYVETWNATENAAMLSINKALGFSPVLEWEAWEVEASELLSRLEGKIAVE